MNGKRKLNLFEKISIVAIISLLIIFSLKVFEKDEVYAFTYSPHPLLKDHTVSKKVLGSSQQPFNMKNVPNSKINDKEVYLTFDDGPSSSTGNLLKILDSYEIKATFFMLEPNMRTYEKMVKKLVKEGHVPALHGVTHDKDKIYRSKKTLVGEMVKGQEAVREITGITTTLIRTPYGSHPYMKKGYKAAVKEAGFQLWDWTIDSEDWKYKNGEFVDCVIQQLESTNTEKPKIILLHDREATTKHLDKLLDYLKKNGYEAKILSEQLTAYHF